MNSLVSDASMNISEDDIDRYETDGVVVIRGLFKDWVPTLQSGVDSNMSEPGPFARFYTPEGESGHFFGDYCNWQRINEYREFVSQSQLGAAASRLMRSAEVRFFHEHVLVKEPGTGERTPWHHDQPYYSIDGKQNVSFWIPLDPVEKDVCPEFIKGSHAWGKWYNPTRFTGQDWDREQAAENMEFIPDIEASRDEYEIVSWSLEPGDALAFNFLTIHGAPPNLSKERRRGFSARVIGDDATWATRTGETSPPFPELHKRLDHGASLETVDEFPLIYGA